MEFNDAYLNQPLSTKIEYLETHKNILVKPRHYFELIPIKGESSDIKTIFIDRLLILYPIDTKVFIKSDKNVNILRMDIVNLYQTATNIGGKDYESNIIESVKLLGEGYAILGIYEIKDSFLRFKLDSNDNIKIYLTNILVETKGENAGKEKEEEKRIEEEINLMRYKEIELEIEEKNRLEEYLKSYV